MIHSVLSYMDSWELVSKKYLNEFSTLKRAIERYVNGEVLLAEDEGRHNSRAHWEKALFDEGWNISEQSVYTNSGRKRTVRFLGPQLGGLAAQVSFHNPDFLSRWLFNYATIGVKNGIVEIPILIVPMNEALTTDESRRPLSRLGTFEYYQEQLDLLSPLSVSHPFLIIGYSNKASNSDSNVFELEAEPGLSEPDSSVVINKSIEFPPEYHQAGIGILNFFSTYLNENYPSQNATVRIEQNGLNVRMVVESSDGNSEVIEKALHEYELIMSGSETATKFTQNEKLILDLRNEARVANFRIESQQDIISLQNSKLQGSEARIDVLLGLIGQGLKKEPMTINVEVNPCIQNNTSIALNLDISSSLGCLDELTDLMPKDDEVCLPILDLTKSLQQLESEKDPSKVRSSSAMTKFLRFIDKISDENSSIRKAIDKTQQGFEVAADLVGKYNKIASWCGLPSVPTFK